MISSFLGLFGIVALYAEIYKAKFNLMKDVKTRIKCWMHLILLMISVNLANAQSDLSIPAADGEQNRLGEFVWIDLITPDAKVGKVFLSELLEWNIKGSKDYMVAYSGSKPVAGVMEDGEITPGEQSSYWLLSAPVKNISEAVKTVKDQGGKVLSEPESIPGRGQVTLVEDAQGAYFSMTQGVDYPKASKARPGEWLWTELWTNDPGAANSFYQKVLQSTSRKIDDSGKDYFVLKGESYEFGGITELPVADESPIWIPVLRVQNADYTSKRAIELGGSILIEATIVSGNKVALITTPFGAPFLIQEWND